MKVIEQGNGAPAPDQPMLVRVPGSASPAQFQEVRLAFRQASSLAPEPEQPPVGGWRVGICNTAGEVAAHGTFPSFNQVCAFAWTLEEGCGYEAVLFARISQPVECDLLLRPVVVDAGPDSTRPLLLDST